MGTWDLGKYLPKIFFLLSCHLFYTDISATSLTSRNSVGCVGDSVKVSPLLNLQDTKYRIAMRQAGLGGTDKKYPALNCMCINVVLLCWIILISKLVLYSPVEPVDTKNILSLAPTGALYVTDCDSIGPQSALDVIAVLLFMNSIKGQDPNIATSEKSQAITPFNFFFYYSNYSGS